MDIAYWFPISVGLAKNTTVDNDQLRDYCLKLSERNPSGGINWLNKSTYNTECTYSLLKDKTFSPINKWVERQVNIYAKELKFSGRYKIKDGWFSLYRKGDSQEFHTHPGHTFSCVYCISAPDDSSPLILQSPNEPDMMNPRIDEWNNVNALVCNYKAVVGRLIIFRSYVRHYVPPNQGDGPRITLEYNF